MSNSSSMNHFDPAGAGEAAAAATSAASTSASTSTLPATTAAAAAQSSSSSQLTRENLAALASSLAQTPLQSFAAGPQANAASHSACLQALQHIFTHAVSSEPGAAPHIIPFLHTIHPEPAAAGAAPPTAAAAAGSSSNGTAAEPASRKRKRGGMKQAQQQGSQPPPNRHSLFSPTPLDRLVLEGMDAEQLWAQLELRTAPMHKMINALIVTEQLGEDEQDAEASLEDDEEDGDGSDSAWFTDEESGNESSDVELEPDGLLDLVDPQDEDEDEDEDLLEFGINGSSSQGRETADQPKRSTRVRFHEQVAVRHIQPRKGRDDESDEDDSDDEDDDEDEDDDDEESDEGDEFMDEVIAQQQTGLSGSQLNGAEHDEDDDDDDYDEDEASSKPNNTLNVEDGESDDDDDDDDELTDDSGIDLFQDVLADDDAGEADATFADFFGDASSADPQRKPAKRARLSASASGQDADEQNGDHADDDDDLGLGFAEEDDLDADLDEDDDEEGEDEDDLDDDVDMEFDDEGTAQRVANDLFAEEAPAKGTEALSRFEKRQAALQDEIAALERENVAKKDWTMRGEIGAPSRPVNSLLEEDLEFEQSKKRAPVITEASTQSLEDRIKARILENRFDDVERRFASLERDAFLPSRMLELSDAKSGKSLAELYEDEYQGGGSSSSAAAAGGSSSGVAGGSEADRKLEAEHLAITGLFEEVCGKLDALSNAHYTPKAPKATIQTLTNAPTIALESALPTHARSAASTMLAPEEVFAPAQGGSATALVGDRSEMTPAQKQALHERLRREKKRRNERIGKVGEERERARSGGSSGSSGSGAVKGKKGEKEAKEAALKKLIGNKGVSVIGKDGKTRTGKEALGGSSKGGKPPSSSSKGKKAGSQHASASEDAGANRSGSSLKL